MPAAKNDDLFPDARNPECLRVINERCLLRNQDGHCVVVVSGMVLAQYASNDRMAEAHAMVSLAEQGWADQIEIARAFVCSARTVRRYQRRFESGGLAALGHGDGYPQGRARLANARERLVQRLKASGVGQREIARRIGVNEKAVRKLLRRLDWKPADSANQLTFEAPAVESSPPFSPKSTALQTDGSADPNLSAFGDAVQTYPARHDTDPSDRSADRLLARLGLLEDAPAMFGSAAAVPRAGVLLALPALIASGVFECAQKVYGSLGPSFYGLRTSLLTLLLMALWRIKRPENLKEYSPQSLGRVLGLDRAPEVKTLRRKLASLAATGRAARFGDALAQQRVALRGKAMGFLYVAGHVRVYHGQHALPKAHVARMRISLPATSD
jgi:transposase